MKEVQLLSAADAGVNATSIPYCIGDFRDYSVNVSFSSASLNGSVALQASNTENSSYITISDSVQSITSGAGHMWSVMGAAYKYVRVAWTRSSGTGTITADFLLKEFPIKWG